MKVKKFLKFDRITIEEAMFLGVGMLILGMSILGILSMLFCGRY